MRAALRRIKFPGGFRNVAYRWSNVERGSNAIDSRVSDFYRFCESGNIDAVLQILDADDAPTIGQLNALQPNGNTALHVATENGHVELVELLLDRGFSQRSRNRAGQRAYELASGAEMRQAFYRHDWQSRFHESDIVGAFTLNLRSNDPDSIALEYVRIITSEGETRAHAENQQTTATWINFYHWFTTRFPRLVRSAQFSPDQFALHKHYDLLKFLQLHVTNRTNYDFVMEFLTTAHEDNTIIPLIELYSHTRYSFFSILNEQLAHPTGCPHLSPHLCDRFVVEFHLHQAELRRFGFTGTTYRGVTMSAEQLVVYRGALVSEPPGIIELKTFTSTSKDEEMARWFIDMHRTTNDQRGVLFVFEVREASPTIIDVEPVSMVPVEREVLMLPGNLFTVTRIVEDEESNMTTIYLRYMHIRVPFWKKLRQVVISAMTPPA